MSADVVIPVYGQSALLRRCLASVARHTRPDVRVIVIDDASPDEETRQAIDELARDPRFFVFRNPENRGFAATVNRGFRMSRRDVVILNSDTIVTDAWLDKMRECAAAKPDVATVTPLTNDGTICAIPEWNRSNPVPEGLTLDEWAKLVERLSDRSYPDLPTGVGFCMLFTRRALDAVGWLDVLTFGSGYGEENDWCMRAAALGFRHALDNATFVYHEGGSSFGASKTEKLERSYRVLVGRHPHYHELVHSFIARNPLQPIHRAIRTALRARETGRPRVLVLLHTPLETLGGTEGHTRDLVASAPGVDFLVLYPSAGRMVLEEIRDAEPVARDVFSAEGEESKPESWWHGLMRRFSIDVLHVQHLLRQDDGVIAAAKSLGIPVVLAWHDYYLLCPRYTLINDRGVFCDWCTDLAECDRCLEASSGIAAGTQRAWRKRSLALVERADALVFPSEASLAGARRVLAVSESKAHVIPHGLWPSEPRPLSSEAPSGRLRVAFLGVWSPAKGSEVFSGIVARLGQQDFEWHVFGACVEGLEHTIPRGVVAHGRFERDQVGAALAAAGIDVVVLPSIWPETFSYTLSEAWAAGLPVLGSRLGAIGERIAATGAGWLFDPRRPDEAVDVLGRLAGDRRELAEKTACARGMRPRRTSEMAAEYVVLYRRLLGIAPARRSLPPPATTPARAEEREPAPPDGSPG